MIKGIVLALVACFVWGFIFIIPAYIPLFDPIEIALGRHTMFGLISCTFLLYFMIRLKRRYPYRVWKQALIFALIANIMYYVCLVLSIKLASATVAALAMGISPIFIACYGNWLEKEMNFKNLLVPALLIFSGIILIHYPMIKDLDHAEMNFNYGLGLLGALFALVSWCWFVVMNAQFLKKNPEIGAAEWATILGASTFFWAFTLGLIYESFQSAQHLQRFSFHSSEFQVFLLGCAFLGVISSWLGAYIWSQASVLLPVSLAGQLSIFETVFGLVFFYIVEQAYPPLLEIVGILLILVAVVLSIGSAEEQEAMHV